MTKILRIAASHAAAGCALTILLVSAGCARREAPVWVTTLSAPPEQIALTESEPITPPGHDTRVTREPVGAFVVLEERYEAKVLVMHAPSQWTKIHLSFESPDGRVNVALTDDGETLAASAESPGCFAHLSYLQYGGEDEQHLYRAMLGAFDHLAKACGKGLENPTGYRRLLEGARGDFPAAIRAMKARVTAAFGGRVKRCRAPTREEWTPDPLAPCNME